MEKSVIITGGTGFLGVHLSRYFLKLKYKINDISVAVVEPKKYKIILLDTAPLTADDIRAKVDVANVDITDKKTVDQYFKTIKPDFVVHAAAALPIHNDREYIYKVNIDGTRNILDASLKNKVKKLTFISTTAMYGIPDDLPERETSALHPIGYYGESKAEGEKLCMKYLKKGLAVNIIRPKTFLGPERLGVFTIWFEAIFNHKPVFILGNGNNLYQLLEVQDLCSLIEKTLLTKIKGEIFNAGTDKFGTWKEDLSALIKHAKSKSKIIGLPVLPAQIALSILEKLHMSPIVAWHYKTFPVNSYVSIEKAQNKLGFIPTKSNKVILIESYDWYKKHRKEFLGREGKTHRTIWNFKILDIITKWL